MSQNGQASTEAGSQLSGFWRDQRVFVTGVAGLLGGALVKQLLEAGARVVCLIHNRPLPDHLLAKDAVHRLTVVRGGVGDRSLIEAALENHQIESVFHTAAQAIVGIGNRDPLATFETNIGGTWSVLEACRKVKSVRQVVFTSSDKAYGAQGGLPYVEDMPLLAGRPYETSKACADLLASSYAVSFRLPVVITRCGNFFGGGDLNWNRIVPGTIRSLAEGRRPVIRSDGMSVRDYLYVEDGALAHLHLAAKLAADRALTGEAFNFSHEVRLTALEMVTKISRLMGSSLAPEILGEAGDEIRVQYLSSAKAREKLAWKPRFQLEEGLEQTIRWYREQVFERETAVGDAERVGR